MQWKNIQNFIKGLFENEGKEARIADEFLVKLYNVDIDVSGKLISRYGYEYWQDLINNNSVPSLQGLPDTVNKTGFGKRIQKVFQYIDVAGVSYIVVICDGKVYIETKEGDTRQWSCITPNFSFIHKVKRIDVTSYLDILFFNDAGNNVYFYDSQSYVGGGWVILGNRFIYFAGDTIYFRKYTDFSALSSENIKIEDNPQNPAGKAIYDSLTNIEYPYKKNLQLGYALKVGNEDIGVYYYVLDNGKNQRGDNKCQIIKFNDRFIAQDWHEFDMDPNGEILAFDYYKNPEEDVGYIYIMTQDGRIEKLDEVNLHNTPINSNDVTGLTAPVNVEGKKLYTITVNKYGIFTYSMTLPLKNDWWQPIPLRQSDVIDYKSPGDLYYQRSQESVFYWLNYSSITIIDKKSEEIGFEYRLYDNGITGHIQSMFRGCHEIIGSYGGFQAYFHGLFLRKVYTSAIVYFRKELNDSLLPNYTIGDVSFLFSWEADKKAHSISYMINHIYKTLDTSHPTYKFIRESNNYDFNNYKGYFADPIFADENWVFPKVQIYSPQTDKLVRIDKNVFMLYNNDYNNEIFNSLTESNYVLLVGLDFNGNLLIKKIDAIDEGEKFWRFIMPAGKLSAMLNLCNIFFDNQIIYFGSLPKKSNNNWQQGWITGFNIDTLSFSPYYVDYSIIINNEPKYILYRTKIQGDKRFLIHRGIFWSDTYVSELKISNNLSNKNATLPYTDYTNLLTFNSNLLFHIKKQVIDLAGNVQIDKIQALGSPKIPQITMTFDNTTDFIPGTKFKYQVAFQFYSGKTTMLSPESEEITIPDLGVGNNVKIIISELDLLDARGIELYSKDDIEAIQLYRKQKDPDKNYWTEPILIATISNENIGVITTYEDKQQNYTYNPFTEINTEKFPVNDIFVHKSRLVLVNKLDYKNSSVIQYSEVDMARAIAPDQIRPIESGDGDYLVAGISAGDYCYLFKSSKIYAILGDVATGQLIDVSKKIGTKYKDLIVVYNNVVYFMNDDSIYRIIPGNPPENLMKKRIRNYFDKQRDDSIDFDNLTEHGFAYVDIEKKEIKFFVPQKRSYEQEVRNNLVLIYNIEYDFFKVYEYYHNIFDETYIKNVLTGEYEDLLADYDGNIFKITKSKNDNNKEIKWIIRTKEFNLGTDTFNKIFKMIKVFGKFLNNIRITYWIDGERYKGDIYFRDKIRDRMAALLKVWSRGKATRLMIEISGIQLNEPPVEIEEILIGFQPSRGIR